MVALRRSGLIALALLAAPLGCDDSDSGTPAQQPDPALVSRPLAPVALLNRVSLDLAGRRPSVEEIDRVIADAGAVDAIIDDLLQEPSFGARVRALFAPSYRTRIDVYDVRAGEYGIDDEFGFQRSVGDEPLQLVSYLAENDRPYTEIVTADYTMANEHLLEAWPLESLRGEDDEGWRRARYTDGRQMAGVLSQNAIYWRYPSNGVNYNRGRANALSRILLCNDYLDRPVDFPRDIDLTDEETVREAVTTNQGCLACHVSLDPFASYLFGFTYAGQTKGEMTIYHPERERGWERATGLEPAYFGRPGFTLRDLGQDIAADPRLISCAVRTVYEGLLGRPLEVMDTDVMNFHRQAFLDSGLQLRALIRSIVSDSRYRAERPEDVGGVRMKVLPPDLLSSSIEALTGYRFSINGLDMMDTDIFGLRSLAGGGDNGGSGSGPTSPGTTMVLVQERLAQAAAFHAVAQEAAGERAEGERLFTEVSLGSAQAPEEAMARAQIAALHRRLFGIVVAADSAEVDAGYALFVELVAAEGDARRAWAGLLSAYLRDPDFVLY